MDYKEKEIEKRRDKERDAESKSRSLCKILDHGPVYGYGRETVMNFIRERIIDFLYEYFHKNNCNTNDVFCNIYDDEANEDVAIDLPYIRIRWVTNCGHVFTSFNKFNTYSNSKYEDIESDNLILFYDFDDNKYKRTPEQIYYYLKTVTCKRIIDIIKNFYDKRLAKTTYNEIKPLESVDFKKVENTEEIEIINESN